MGVRRDEIAEGLRACPVRRHVVFYRDRPDRVDVVRILHERMDPARHLPPARGSPTLNNPNE